MKWRFILLQLKSSFNQQDVIELLSVCPWWYLPWLSIDSGRNDYCPHSLQSSSSTFQSPLIKSKPPLLVRIWCLDHKVINCHSCALRLYLLILIILIRVRSSSNPAQFKSLLLLLPSSLVLPSINCNRRTSRWKVLCTNIRMMELIIAII